MNFAEQVTVLPTWATHSATWEVFTQSLNPIGQAHPQPRVNQASLARSDLSVNVQERLGVLALWPLSLRESEERDLGSKGRRGPDQPSEADSNGPQDARPVPSCQETCLHGLSCRLKP